MKRTIQFLLAITWALLLTPAHAQSTYTGLDHINRIIAGTPGVAGYTIGGVQDGVTLRTTGNVLVGAPNGARIAVPVTAQAGISKAAMAKAAAKLVAGASAIGTAYQAYEVYKWIKDSGIQTCAPPDFFCKPGNVVQNGTWYSIPNGFSTYNPREFYSTDGKWYLTTDAACQYVGAKLTGQGYPTNTAFVFTGAYRNCSPGGPPQYEIRRASDGVTSWSSNDGTTASISMTSKIACDSAGTAPVGGTCTGTSTTGGPYTQAELESGLIGTGTNWDPARSKAMNDAILADNARQKLLTQEDLKPGTSAVTWPDLAPVTGPATLTKTETVPNADGSTSTRKTTETVTVTPVAPAASTLAAPASPEFKTSTSTVVTTTNNTTNVTTTESTSVTNSTTTEAAPKLEFPTDYARENTVQQIERDLNTDAAKELPDQDKRVTDGVKDSEDRLKALRDAVATAQQSDKSLWFSWVWTPPVGTCQAKTATLSGHALVNWDICPTVNNIKDVLGWMMALFSCWSIYCEIFRSPND